MNFLKIAIAITCIAVLVPIGCQKDSLEKDEMEDSNSQLLARDGDQNIFITGGGASEDTSINITTLGPTRENPYTVENFTAAYNELYDPDISSLPITDYYIKFTPTTHEEVEILATSD